MPPIDWANWPGKPEENVRFYISEETIKELSAICTCGHPFSGHTIHGRYRDECQDAECECNYFTPAEALGMCTINVNHNAMECNGYHLDQDDI